MMYLYVFIGGGLGSLSRFLLSNAANGLFETKFPLGTFISNMLACVLLAILVLGANEYQEEHSWLQPLMIIGFCGGFSTFSAFSHETVQLIDQGSLGIAILNILVSIAVGIGLIFLIRTKA